MASFRERDLVLGTDCFFVREQRYPIDEIESIFYYYVQTQKYMNFVAAGIDHDVSVGLYMRGDKQPIRVVSRGRFNIASGKKPSESLRSKFDYLSRSSFDNRAARYMKQLNRDGFFVYDGNKIFRNGDVIAGDWRFNLMSDRPILKSPFLIFYETRASGFLRKRIRYEINIRFDADVFFSILGIFFGLRWS
jgi:hypothetical protein